MLLGYGARNCWCFRDWMEVDLSLKDNVPEDVSMGLPAATAMCFMGANASGKSNGLRVLSFILDFATESFLSRPDDRIPFETHFNEGGEAEFYLTMETGNAVYLYELRATEKAVIEERISVKTGEKGSEETIVLKREGDAVVMNSLYEGHSDIPLRSNASVISTLHQFGIGEIDDLHSALSTLENEDGWHEYTEKACLHLLKNHCQLERIGSILRKFDTGIEKVVIDYRTEPDGRVRHFPVFLHERGNDSPVPMTLDSESGGTRRLFFIIFSFLRTLERGGLLIIDGLGGHFHPDILRHLTGMFMSEDENSRHAQLLFVTQDTDLMDTMGSHRTYLFEKEDGESICYRVDELGPKNLGNDRPISFQYRRKLLGGVPVIREE